MKTSAACCLADSLALPSAHHRSTPASGEALQHSGDCSCQPAQGQGAILNLLLLLDRGAQLCKYKPCFPISYAPRIMMLKKTETRKRIGKLHHMRENVVEVVAPRKN